MTDEEKTSYFIDLYIIALQSFYNNDFLRPPNPTSERYAQLNEARIICDKIGAEYSDYIRFHFDMLRGRKTAPKPAHLISLKIVKMYRAYQMKHNKSITKEYTTNEDRFIVNATRKMYHLDQVLLPVSQDSIASMAYQYIEETPVSELSAAEVPKVLEYLYYLRAKLTYKGAVTPTRVKEMIEKLEEKHRNSF